MSRRPEPLLAALLLLPAAVAAQEAPSKGLDARLGMSLLVSDNLGGAPGFEDAGAVLTLSPGLGYRLRSGGAVADIDYTANLLIPMRVSTPMRRLQNDLRGSARVSDADSGLALQLRADIGQQTQSVLGPQRGSGDYSQRNRAEVMRLQLEPSWQRRLAGVAELQLSHSAQFSNTRQSVVGDSSQQISSAALRGLARGPLNWGMDLQRSETRIRQGRDTFFELARASLSWQPDVDWQFGLSGGRERSDVLLAGEREQSIYGASMRWQPGPRTVVAGSFEERVAGRTHAIELQHRFARSSFSYNDLRSVTQPGSLGAVGAQTNFDLLFAQFASIEPDPDRRADLVRSLLQQQGLDPNAQTTLGLIAGRSALTRTRSLGAAYSFLRSTLTLSVSRTDSERLGAAGDAQDDFALTPNIQTRGISLSWAHRLTPISGISLIGQVQRNEGAAGIGESTLKSATLAWTTRFGPRTQGSLSLRVSRFASTVNPYDENALLASLNHQF